MNLNRRPLRVYADTTIFGGIVDVEFERASRIFFEEVRAGQFKLVVSSLIQSEIRLAPVAVQRVFEEFSTQTEQESITEEALRLQSAYLNAGFVRKKSLNDALHVALATTSHCAFIVSWNFRDIVNFRKIPLYNAVNAENGYGNIAIYSPLEVIEDEA